MNFDWNNFQIYSEILDSSVLTWHRMRGTQMIAAVKIISIGFDMDRKLIRYSPNFLEFWGYVLCPGNVIMGPWCAYNDYLNIFNRTKWVSLHHHSFLIERFFYSIKSNFIARLMIFFSLNDLVIYVDISSVFERFHCHIFPACLKLFHWSLRARSGFCVSYSNNICHV